MSTPTTAATEPQLLTLTDLMTMLRVSRNTAYARTREDDFPLPYVFGAAYRWPRDEVEAWFQAQRATSRDIAPRGGKAAKPAARAKKTTVTREAPLPTPRAVAKRTVLPGETR